MKKQLTTKILVITIMITLFNSPLSYSVGSSDDLASSATEGSGWVQNAKSRTVIKFHSVDINIGLDITPESKPGIGFNISPGFNILRCCRYIDDNYSWCNISLQDQGC